MAEAKHNYYMVRAMGQTDLEFKLLFDNNIIAVGWSRVNFSSFDDMEALLREVKVKYHYEKISPQVVGRRLAQIRRFINIKAGDRIILPYYDSVCLAEALSEQLYNPSVGDGGLDLSNQRKVKYILGDNKKPINIPRKQLSERLQRRLRVRGSTVADLYEFGDEVKDLFGPEIITWFQQSHKIEEELKKNFLIQLWSNLQEGNIGLQTGGIGLEHVVKELLEIEGYEAKIASKCAFPDFADADIIATKADRLGEVNLLVQVKHHKGASGTWGAEQLKEIIRQQPDRFSDHKLILITSAEASKNLQVMCEDQNITLIGGDELVQWIADSVAKLRIETKMKLGISDVPRLLVESH